MRLTPIKRTLKHLVEALEALDLIHPDTIPKLSRRKLALAIWELQRVHAEVKAQ